MTGRCKYCRSKATRASVFVRGTDARIVNTIESLDAIEICASEDCSARAFYERHPGLRP